MGTRLQACHQPFDFLGGFLRALGQAAHFIGHHRKATSGLACAGRFDGRVEGQQVGLFGHGLDHVHDAADLVAFLLQRVHRFGGAADFLGQLFDLRNRFADDPVALAGFLVSRGRSHRGLLGVASHFLNGRGHLVHGGGDLIGLDLLIVDPGTGLLGDGRQLFGGAGDLGNAVADATDQFAQGGAHALDALLQHAQFVLARHLQVVAEVATGDALDHVQGLLQRAGDLPGDDPGGEDAEDQCQQCRADLIAARFGAFGIAALDLDLVQLIAEADDFRAFDGHLGASGSDGGNRCFEAGHRIAVIDQCGNELLHAGLLGRQASGQLLQFDCGAVHLRECSLLGFFVGVADIGKHFIARLLGQFPNPGAGLQFFEAQLDVGYGEYGVVDLSDQCSGGRCRVGHVLPRHVARLVAVAHLVERLLVRLDLFRLGFEPLQVFRALESFDQLLLLSLESVELGLNGLRRSVVAVGQHVLQPHDTQLGQAVVELGNIAHPVAALDQAAQAGPAGQRQQRGQYQHQAEAQCKFSGNADIAEPAVHKMCS